MKQKHGNVFWGILLIMAGVMFALRNFEIIDFTWYSFLRLWPLLLVLWGISVLPVKPGYKVLFSSLAVLFAVAIIIRYPDYRMRLFGQDWIEWRSDKEDKKDETWKEQHFTERYDSTFKTAYIGLDVAAGTFVLENATDMLFKFDHEGRAGRYNLDIEEMDDTKRIMLSLSDTKGNIRRKNTSELALNPNPLWTIALDAAASGTEIDLSAFKVRSLEVDGAASEISIKLGILQEVTHVTIDAAVTSLDLILPEMASIELRTSTVLSLRDIEGFEKIEKGLYRSPGFSDQASHSIIIELDAAVSGVNVELYR
ncbi:MAG: hypothetical protein JXA03_13050 [Bacteroidales bacterium]|nr:hypothetical protein [Bacteroidales bacterium]